MKYYFGVDGGGTKTHSYIGDEEGNILGEGFGGRCNYQMCGIEEAKESIITSLTIALAKANVKIEQLAYGVLGLSGADEACDFKVLNKCCLEIFGSIPFKVVNDTWIGLRTGSDFGVISICGTGAAHAGVSKTGVHKILRNIDFETGNRGGGSEIVTNALHFAFRSNEGTYKKSLLEDMVLEVFESENMDEVCELIREDNISNEVNYKIPVEVLKLATNGDRVACEIVEDMGYTEGLYARSLIKQLGLENEQVPMVLIGGLFKTNHKVLIDSYLKAVREVAPNAYPIIPDRPPVHGALLLAIEEKNYIKSYEVQSFDNDINWDAVSPLIIDDFPWYEAGQKQNTFVQVAQKSDVLYIKVKAIDCHSSAKHLEENASVYLDSCFEFFLTPEANLSESYINFEINCVGNLYLAVRDSKGKRRANTKELDQVKITTSLPYKRVKEVFDLDDFWTLDIEIPFAFIEEFYGKAIDRELWHGNFYRIGGDTDDQYSVWNHIKTEKPDFHQPLQFGRIALK